MRSIVEAATAHYYASKGQTETCVVERSLGPAVIDDCTGCEHKFGIASPFSLYSINGGAPTTPPS